jgi:poly(hydroxyalkanoate) depolymerase family esterase
MRRDPVVFWMPQWSRRAIRALATAACILMSCAAPSLSGSFSEVPNFGSNPGHLKMFKYLPDRISDQAPLVVVLHGCLQTAKGYHEHSGWAKYADQGSFVLLYPEQQTGQGPVFLPSGLNHPSRCFNFAELRDSRRDSGEALSIKQMIDKIRLDHGIDPRRIFVTGLSAGGGMTAVMMAVYPELFAGGAPIAGLPYRCGMRTATGDVDCGITVSQPHKSAPDHTPAEWGKRVRDAMPSFSGPYPRVSIWQGMADKVVDPPNARELVEQWTNVHGIDQTPDGREDGGNFTHPLFKDAQGNVLVESYEIQGMDHATPIDPNGAVEPCGTSGDRWIVDADICSSYRIARFWGLLGTPPIVAITSATSQGTKVTISGTASDPDGTVTEIAVRLDGPIPQASRTAQGTNTWSIEFGNLTTDRFYVPVITATDNDGLHMTIAGQPVPVGRPPVNQPPTATVDQVKVEQDCIIVNGQASDLDGRVIDVSVKLGSRSPQPAVLTQNRYEFQECRLPDGSYATEVQVKDDQQAITSVRGSPDAVVQAKPSAEANWQAHMSAGRLRLYQAPCPSVGFGACDAAFPAILQEHGSDPFKLFHRTSSNDWYLNPANIP